MSRMISREEKLDLIMRMLGLRHKLKVHDSMKAPETHEEISSSLLGRWELEDEIKAIEILIEHDRALVVEAKLKQVTEDYLSGVPRPPKKQK